MGSICYVSILNTKKLMVIEAAVNRERVANNREWFNSIIRTYNRNSFSASYVLLSECKGSASIKKFDRVLICRCDKKFSLQQTESVSIGTIGLKLMMIQLEAKLLDPLEFLPLYSMLNKSNYWNPFFH